MRIKDKINKKKDNITLSSVCITKFYSFVIDGTLNKPSLALKWYIKSLSLILKRFLLDDDLKTALTKATEYTYKKYKNNFTQMPIISLGVCKNNDGILEIAVINDIKCYLKNNDIITITDNVINNYENKLFDEINSGKVISKQDIYHNILDINSYTYYTVSYDEPFSILFCNRVFQNYQRYLKLEDDSFNTLIKEQGFRYCLGHIKRIEKANTGNNKHLFDSSVSAIYKVLI